MCKGHVVLEVILCDVKRLIERTNQRKVEDFSVLRHHCRLYGVDMASVAILVHIQHFESMRLSHVFIQSAGSSELCFMAKLATQLIFVFTFGVHELWLLLGVFIRANTVHFTRIKVRLDQSFERFLDDNSKVLQTILVNLDLLLVKDYIDDWILVKIPKNCCDVNFVLVLVVVNEGKLTNLFGDVLIAEIAHDLLLAPQLLHSIQL